MAPRYTPGVANSGRKLRERVLVRAAGGLVWRTGRGGPKLAVIHRPKHRDWSLPKGKLEPGEAFAAAALREVAEETGCRARLGDFAGFTLCSVKKRPKLVLFWHMSAEDPADFEPNHEVDRLEWLAPEDAVERLHNPSERRLVRGALPKASRPRGSRRRHDAASRAASTER